MKIFSRITVYQMLPGMEKRGDINGRPYNFSLTVTFYKLKDGFKWTLDTGNRVRNLRGPFPTIEEAEAAAKTQLEAF